MSTEDRIKVMQKVQALLNKAEGTNFPAEREAFMAKALQIQREHAIEEFELDQVKPRDSRTEPSFYEMRYYTEGLDDQVAWAIKQMAHEMLKFCHCRFSTNQYKKSEAGEWQNFLEVIAFPGDFEFFQMMFTSVRMQMSREMNPSRDDSLSEAENLSRMKLAGFIWKDIHTKMYPDVPWERRHGVRYTAVYKKYCQANGIVGQTTSGVRTYRTDFIQWYSYSITERLRKIRVAQDSGGGLVIVSMKDALDEKYYEKFPDARPHPESCECDDCHFPKCADEKCTRPRCARYWSDKGKPVRSTKATRQRTANPQAYRHARDAAARADLGLNNGLGKDQPRGEI